MKYLTTDVHEFLKESNAIEGVYDKDSFDQSLIAWNFLKKQKKLTIGVILKLHKLLMLNQSIPGYTKGYFRTQPVWIGGKEVLEYRKIMDQIIQLIVNMNDITQNGRESSIFLEKTIKSHHVLYEGIHPFIDGNGRTGRMLMNWERMMVGLPILIIHEGPEQMDYYKWFQP